MSIEDKDLRGDRHLLAYLPGQATAGTVDEFIVGKLPYDVVITGVRFIPKTAVTGAATNNFALTLRNRTTGAGAVQVAITTYASGTDSAAFVGNALTLSATAADLNVAAGDVLTAEKVVNASGLAMPAGHLDVTYRRR